MSPNHVDTIRKLALENSRLHDALIKAEKLHFEATGKSLVAQLGLVGLVTPDAPGAAKSLEPLPQTVSSTTGYLSPEMKALNRLKAPALQSNPSNYINGNYPLTDEQQECIEAAVSGCSLKIEAGAGSGKTSTLSAISNHMGKRKGLYLAFNTSVIKDARGRFHTNTTPSTSHSVAFKAVGHLYKHRLTKKNLPGQVIIDALKLREWNGISIWAQANIIRSWVTNFTQSDQPYPTKKCAPWKQINLLTKKTDKHEAYIAGQPIAEQLQPAAIQLWDMLRDIHGTLPIWPDVYFKVWALTEPVIAADFILLDESQDTAAVLLKVLREQSSQVMWVGDRRQQIYGWRGAINAMDAITTERTTNLTRSFRYGQPIAAMANKVLENFLDEKTFKIVGSPMVESRLCEVSNPKAILCRGNRGALGELMEALKLGKKVHMAGDVSSLIMEIESCISLMQGRRPRSPDFQAFQTWLEVLEYADSEVGGELSTLIKLLDLWPPEELLAALNSVHKVSQAEADLTISTVHKAKGLEFPSVRLADDFSFPATDTAKPKIPFSAEEAHIFYVALTRAQYELDVTQCRAAQVALEM